MSLARLHHASSSRQNWRQLSRSRSGVEEARCRAQWVIAVAISFRGTSRKCPLHPLPRTPQPSRLKPLKLQGARQLCIIPTARWRCSPPTHPLPHAFPFSLPVSIAHTLAATLRRSFSTSPPAKTAEYSPTRRDSRNGRCAPPANPDPACAGASEQDVLQVLDLVKQHYRVDDRRIYLMGHSMGAIGTWKIAAESPDIWAALGLGAGSGAPATVERMRALPGVRRARRRNPTVNVMGSRTMVAKMKELGVTVHYIEVPGGNHSDVVAPHLGGMMEFFNRSPCGPRVPRSLRGDQAVAMRVPVDR